MKLKFNNDKISIIKKDKNDDFINSISNRH